MTITVKEDSVPKSFLSQNSKNLPNVTGRGTKMSTGPVGNVSDT